MSLIYCPTHCSCNLIVSQELNISAVFLDLLLIFGQATLCHRQDSNSEHQRLETNDYLLNVTTPRPLILPMYTFIKQRSTFSFVFS